MIPQKTSAHSGVRASLAVHGLGRDRTLVRAEAPTLIVTIEAAIAQATSGSADLVLDRSGCLLLPRGARVALSARAPASRVVVLSFHEPLFVLVARTYKKLGVDRMRLDRWSRRLELLPRTVWIHEIVHRYLFERYVLGAHENATTRFLETEILKEIHFLFRDRDEGADRATTLRRYSTSVERALAHIEAHLFDGADVAELASRAGSSESTLLRSFRRELGCTPGLYWRNRVLDEALVLLRSGRHSVAEVATRIGYDNPTAFAFAFRRRFGRPPSSFVSRRRTRPAP